MKKSTLITVVVIVILVIAGIVAFGGKGGNTPGNGNDTNSSSTPVVAVSDTTKVSSKVSEYKNSELGFSIKYPNTWEKADKDYGVSFVMPIDKSQVSTVATLQAEVNVYPGKCAFPPITTIKDRGTITVGSQTLNMISMSNTVQGRSYFNRMYSLQKDEVCYMFSFASIALNPASKNLTGSNLTQAQNNNKAIVNSADEEFIAMVKSFAFVTGPQGVDETKAAPIKK